jgi:hypothetical protein
MFEYNIYNNSDNEFIGTFSTLLELKQWAYKISCDSDEEVIKSNIQIFYKLKSSNPKQTQVCLQEWFDWCYKKENLNTHKKYLDE